MNILTRSFVTSLLIFLLASCGDGGSSEVTTDNTLSDTIRFTNNDSNKQTYEIASLTSDSLTFNNNSYTGDIDEQQIELLRVSETEIVFIVPSDTNGQKTLTIDIEGVSYDVSINISSPDNIKDPETYVLTYLDELKIELDSTIQSIQTNPGIGIDLEYLSQISSDIESHTLTIANMPQEELQEFAQTLKLNIIDSSILPKNQMIQASRFSSLNLASDCGGPLIESLKTILVQRKRTVALLVAGGVLLIPPASIYGAILVGVAAGDLLLAMHNTIEKHVEFQNKCAFKQFDKLTNSLGSTQNNANNFVALNQNIDSIEFTSKQSKTFTIISTYEITNLNALSVFSKLKSLFLSALNYLPDNISTGISSKISQGFGSSYDEVSNPSTFTITNISNPDITINHAALGNSIVITFTGGVDVQNMTTFTFDLVDTRTGVSASTTNYSAVLLVPEIDCSIFNDLVVGSWKVGLLGNVPYDLEVHADGTGTYSIDGTDYGMSWRIVRWDEPVPSPWSTTYAPLKPLGVEPGCIFYDKGFWHFAFSGLVRSNLQIPVTGFNKYSLGGPSGWPSEGNYFGYDLSIEEPAVIYTKN